MRTHLLPPIAILCATVALTNCQTYSYRLFQTGVITSRLPQGVGHTSAPAMFVVDDTALSHGHCGHATRFTLPPDVRVFRGNGTKADTSALILGQRVSVYVTKNAAVYLSCPPETAAAKVIVH